MFERFSDQARQAVVLAHEECVERGHAAIDVEHLLAGALRMRLDERPGARAADGQRPFTPAAQATLEAVASLPAADLPDVLAAAARALDLAVGDPPPRPARDGLDIADRRHPVTVALAGELVGDLGHPRVDARLLLALVMRGGPMAEWLAARGVDERAIRERVD